MVRFKQLNIHDGVILTVIGSQTLVVRRISEVLQQFIARQGHIRELLVSNSKYLTHDRYTLGRCFLFVNVSLDVYDVDGVTVNRQ